MPARTRGQATAAPAGAWRPVELFPPGASARAHPLRARLRVVDQERAHTAHQVQQLEATTLRAILPVLAQAQRETALGLRVWMRHVPNGDLRYTAQQHRNVLLHLQTAFATIARLHPTMEAALRGMTHRAGVLSAGHLQHEVARFAEVFAGSEPAIQLNLTRILATGDRYLITRIRTSAARYAGDVGTDIRRELAVGVVRGESVSAMTSRLQRHGGPRGTVALRGVIGEPGAVTEEISEGLFARYRYWAERVVRTETINAYSVQKDEGYREAAEDIPGLKRMWDAAIDGRVCAECAGSHGSIADVDRPFANGVLAPPLHPNCRCTTVPWHADWHEVLRQSGVDQPSPAQPAASPPAPIAPPVIPAPVAPPPASATAAPRPTRVTRTPRQSTGTAAARRRTLAESQGLTRLRAAFANPNSQALERIVRQEADAIVETVGLVHQHWGSEDQRFGIYPKRSRWGAGARGRTSFAGRLEMRADVHASAREFLDRFTGATPRRPTPLQENGFKTLLHETIHNHSPITATAYERTAAAVEETTTELLARRLMRDMFGARGALVAPTLAISRGRSYEREIDLSRRVLERELGVTPENAIAMLEDAAVAMRRYNGPKFVNPDDYLRHFVVNLPLPTTVSAADRMPMLMRLVTAFQAAL